MGQEHQDGDDDNQSGSFSVKQINSIDSSEQPQKRTKSIDRKTTSTDRKKSNQRELKRTTSFIPRATSQRSKTPSAEVKKTERKSETSLKNKEIFDDTSSRERKFEGFKANKIGTDRKTSSESAETKRTPEIPKTSGTTREYAAKEPSATKYTGKSAAKVNTFSDGSNRSGHKLDAKGAQKVNVNADESGSKNLEAQYAAKKTVYGLMVKEFEDKQKNVRDQYKALKDLRNKISASTGKEMDPEAPVVIGDIGPPFMISPDALKKNLETIDHRAIITFETKIFNDIHVDLTDFRNSYEVALNQSREIWTRLISTFMDSRREIIRTLTDLKPDYNKSDLEEEERSLELAIENAKYHSKIKIDDLISGIKKLFTNQETLKQELKTLLDSEKMSTLLQKEYKEMAARLKEVEEELVKEKIRNENLREKRSTLEEANLADAERIENLEQTIAEQQNQLEQLSLQFKSLKNKELLASRGLGGLKPKDIKDLKAKSELLKALENHITELTNDYNSQKKAFQTRIAELERSLGEREETLKTETEAKQALEVALAEAEERIRTVREKKKAFADMVDRTKQLLQTTNSGSTKREEQLWTELEATKIIVKGYQEQITKLTEEKNRIILKFQTISEDKSNQTAERLAADLVRKEEIIRNLKDQVTQLQTACEEHSSKYNKLLAQIKEVHEKMDGKTDAAALSKQLGDMKMQKKELQEVVKDLVTHNEELETALVQRSLELDQRDRLVKQQCNLLKMRDELTDLVRSKDDTQYQGVKKVMEQSSKWEKKAERIYKDLEKKANELDDMYKMLIEKQKQVEKLTKLVKIMEDQQERAQEQRVRFESKIAELQRQISEGKQKTTKTPLFGN